jgi:hypothetical protein
LQQPEPEVVDVAIGFCDEFALDDDAEEVVRMWVLQEETFAIE